MNEIIAMYAVKLITAAIILACSPGIALAGSAGAASERHFGDGEAGAAAGTALYNHMNPSHPLPESRGDTVPDTFRNMGSGMSAKDAWSKAAKDNSGLK